MIIKPILFSTDEVKATLDGRKTEDIQTVVLPKNIRTQENGEYTLFSEGDCYSDCCMACKECKNCKMYCKANNLSHNNRCLYENFECIFRMGYKYKGSSYDDYKIDKYGNEILSDYFYSNCLIEALVARHKNNSYQVRSISIYHHKVKGQLFHHYTWTFENDDWIYEFGTDHKIFSILWYKGYLRRHKKY